MPAPPSGIPPASLARDAPKRSDSAIAHICPVTHSPIAGGGQGCGELRGVVECAKERSIAGSQNGKGGAGDGGRRGRGSDIAANQLFARREVGAKHKFVGFSDDLLRVGKLMDDSKKAYAAESLRRSDAQTDRVEQAGRHDCGTHPAHQKSWREHYEEHRPTSARQGGNHQMSTVRSARAFRFRQFTVRHYISPPAGVNG